MDLELAGKACAVMAASEGLGRAAARALAREGANVAICGRREDNLQATAKALADDSAGEVWPFVADVATPDGAARFVDAAAERFGRLDVLVTNKGGPPPGPFADLDDEAWQRGFDLVVMSYVRAVRAALPHFAAAGGGAVVAIESTSVKQSIPPLFLSNALRPSVVGASKALAQRYAADSVRFNVVLPGLMATERAQELAKVRAEQEGVDVATMRAQQVTEIPIGRIGDPQEVGDAVAYLASARAAFITGSVWAVDGGIIRSVV